MRSHATEYWLMALGLLLALSRPKFGGRACLLCPAFQTSICSATAIINLDSEIADRALDLRVAQQELNRPKISRFLIDQRCLRPAE